MDNRGVTTIAAVFLLISGIVLAATATSVLLGSNESSEADYEQLLDDAVDEIATYIQVKDVVGKYYDVDGKLKIQKIALLIKPMFSLDINLSGLVLKINNGEQIAMHYFNGESDHVGSHPLFEHPLWSSLENNSYSVLILTDKDSSVLEYGTMNKNTDMVYITLQLPPYLSLRNGDEMSITLITSHGVARTIFIEAPLPIKKVVNLT